MKITTKTEAQQKAFKITSVSNAVMVGAFLGTHWLIDPANRSLQATITFWSIFVVSVILLNLSLYSYFKKQAPAIEV